MPRRKFYRRKKRPRYRRRRKATIFRSPIPQKFITRLKYGEQIELDPGAGTISARQFRANSIYQCNATSNLGQPRGRDQFSDMYWHFVVIGSKITCEWCNTGDSGNGYIVGTLLKTSNTTVADIKEILESNNSRHTILGDANASSRRVTTMTYSPKFQGITKPLSSETIRGSTTANPSDTAYYHVVAASARGTTDPAITTCHVTIEYLVAFIEPKVVSAS